MADATSPVYRLGHPLSAKILPFYLNFGYRFSRNASLVPYLGLGVGLASYSEESTVAGVKDTNSQTKFGGQVLAGVTIGKSRVRFGVEATYSRVPNAIGVGGVSKVYGESDIGGFTVLGKIILAPGR